jgi:hypothetical protein
MEIGEVKIGYTYKNAGGGIIGVQSFTKERVQYSYHERGMDKEGSVRMDIFLKCYKPV